MRSFDWAVWIWGTATIGLALGSLLLVFIAGFKLGPDGKFPSDTRFPAGMYHALKDNGPLVAGILGFSALAWSVLFNAVNK